MLFSGCETDSADSPLKIAPSSVSVKQGDTVQFTVSGGYEYAWNLDPDDGSGRLNTRKGATVVYTCLSTTIGTVPKNVRVTSTIPGSSAGASNGPAYQVQAHAEVFYVGDSVAGSGTGSGSGGTGGSTTLTVAPSSATVAPSGTRTFAASGGTAPYSWTVSNSTLGACNPSTGASTTYTAGSVTGTNSITCTDSSGQHVTVTITQTSGGPPPPVP